MHVLEGHPEISYPCSWTYRIICTDEAALRATVARLAADAVHTLANIGGSASGRYQRLELVVSVRDEAHRNAIFAGLGQAPTVRFVL